MSAVKDFGAYLESRFEVRTVPVSQPLTWLRKGFDDMLQRPVSSLSYGVLIAAMGALLLGLGPHPFLVAAAISGFLLIAPVLSTGLCELSRQHEIGNASGFEDSLQALSRNRSGLLTFGGCLLALSAAWFLLSSLMLYLVSFGHGAPALSAALWGGLLDQVTVFQVLSYLVIGGVLAGVVFALSAVTVPLLIDREVDAYDAMRASLQATRANLPAMAAWAGLIVVLTAIGYATFLFGMVVVFPLLGHATWHAYRDIVK